MSRAIPSFAPGLTGPPVARAILVMVSWVCAILGEAKGQSLTANAHSTVSLSVFLLPQWFTGFLMATVISLPVIPRQ